MWKWPKRILWGLAALAAVAYLGTCIWLRINETRLIFSRRLPYIPPPSELSLNQQQVELGEVEGTKLFAGSFPAFPPTAGRAGSSYFMEVETMSL